VKHGALRNLLLVALASGLMALPLSAAACAACFGKSNDAMAQGMNVGIFALLVVIGSVLIGVASFAIFLARRAARFPIAQPSAVTDAELAAPAAQPTNQSHS
jgi:hypothetical protein